MSARENKASKIELNILKERNPDLAAVCNTDEKPHAAAEAALDLHKKAGERAQSSGDSEASSAVNLHPSCLSFDEIILAEDLGGLQSQFNCCETQAGLEAKKLEVKKAKALIQDLAANVKKAVSEQNAARTRQRRNIK